MAEQDPVRVRLCSDERLLASIDRQLEGLRRQQDLDRLSLAKLQKKVAEADSDITELAALRRSLESSITRRRSTLTPRSLPTFPLEILGMIFQLATDAHARSWATLPAPAVSRSLQPFKCASVCRRWHSAAIASPRLWAYIGIPSFMPNATAPRSRWRSRVHQLLQRSGATALHIDIELGLEGCDSDVSEILADLVPHCSRWQSLSLTGCDFEENCNDALRLLLVPTPILESLWISFPTLAGDLRWPSVQPLFLPSAPNLQSVHLEQVPVALDRAQLDLFPATSLSLIEDPYNIPRLRATVLSFAALSKLELYWEEVDNSRFVVPQAPILLPELHTLVLCRDPDDAVTDHESFAAVLDILATPKLRELEMPPDMLPLAEGFTHRCAGTLNVLRLCLGYDLAPEIVPIVAALTALREISFGQCTVTADFLAALREFPGAIWPELQRIVLIENLPLDAQAFVDFLRARYPFDSPGPTCALVEVDMERDRLRRTVAAGEIRLILENERERRRLADADVDVDSISSVVSCACSLTYPIISLRYTLEIEEKRRFWGSYQRRGDVTVKVILPRLEHGATYVHVP